MIFLLLNAYDASLILVLYYFFKDHFFLRFVGDVNEFMIFVVFVKSDFIESFVGFVKAYYVVSFV